MNRKRSEATKWYNRSKKELLAIIFAVVVLSDVVIVLFIDIFPIIAAVFYIKQLNGEDVNNILASLYLLFIFAFAYRKLFRKNVAE